MVWGARSLERAAGGQHIMGGTIMGLDPKGPREFPTNSSVNSTFTAKAMALKSAKFMLANWREVAA